MENFYQKTTVGRAKRDRYSHAIADSKKDQRRTEGQERQAKYDLLTLEEKLARLDFVPGESKKERAKLYRKIAERDAAKAEPVVTEPTEKRTKKAKKTA